MEPPTHSKTGPKSPPTSPRHRGLTFGEAQAMHRRLDDNEGPDYLDAYLAQWRRPSSRESTSTDIKPPSSTKVRPKTYHERSDQHQHRQRQHQRPAPAPTSESEPSQKRGLRKKIKVAKDMLKETLQVGKETVVFIRELHKQYKELTDMQHDKSQRLRGGGGSSGSGSHHGWRAGRRRSSIEYDSD